MTMRAKTIGPLTLPALDTDGLAAAQQTAGAANLKLNGVLASGATATLSGTVVVAIASAGDISTVVFTITGLDASNVVITDTVTGVNANSVNSAKSFASVTSVYASATVGTDVTVGDAGDADGVCVAQQTGGAAYLVLNGAYVSGGTWTSDFAHQLGVYSAGNISTVTFTITGTDQDGKAQTETVTGVNNSTVETTKYFKTVSTIAADGVVGADVIVGTVDEIATQTVPLDVYGEYHTFAVDVTGTLNYDMEVTFGRPNRGETLVWTNDADIVNETSSQHKDTTVKFSAVRVVVNSYTAGATLAFRINPSRD